MTILHFESLLFTWSLKIRCFLYPQRYFMTYNMKNDANSEYIKEYLWAWKCKREA